MKDEPKLTIVLNLIGIEYELRTLYLDQLKIGILDNGNQKKRSFGKLNTETLKLIV